MRGLRISGYIVLGFVALTLALIFVVVGVFVAYMLSTGATWPFVYQHANNLG